MAFFDRFWRKNAEFSLKSGGKSPISTGVRAETYSLNDPRFLEFMRSGEEESRITIDQALKNTAVYRCVSLISNTVGRLPVTLRDRSTRAAVENHPVNDLLAFAPNNFQTPFEFKSLMQAWLLVHGNAFAIKVYTGAKIVALVPIDPTRVKVQQTWDWKMSYVVSQPDGGSDRIVPADEMLHLKAVSKDGIVGLSLVRQAADAIELARSADNSAARMFNRGMMAGGALTYPGKLGADAVRMIKESLESYQGASSKNAFSWFVLEEGMKAEPFQQTSVNSQQLETRNHQIEEIARVFGVPRPFLGMSDTSWGSGIEQLKIMFVDGGLAPFFVIWEEGLARSCLTPSEQKKYYVDFDERELLRGSMKDQAEYLAKATGSGGSMPWMEPNEAREAVGLPPHKDGTGLRPAGSVTTGAPAP